MLQFDRGYVLDESGGEMKGGEGDETPLTLKLSAKGTLINALCPPSHRRLHGGLMCEMRNFMVRSREWPLLSCCSNTKTGEFALYDARGQVFVYSVVANTYQALRLASTPVSAMGFIVSRGYQLVVAYENGLVLVLDTKTRDITGNLQTEFGSPVRFIRSHPSKSMLIMATDDKQLSIWDMRTLRAIRTLECDEPIVDIRFELGGAVIALVLQETGVYFYRSMDFSLLQHCPLPPGERQPLWVAYSSHSLSPFKKSSSGALKSPAKSHMSFVSDPHLRVLLAGDNSMIYVWDVEFPLSYISSSSSSSSSSSTTSFGTSPFASFSRAHERDEQDEEVRIGTLVGVVELPIKMKMAIALCSLAPARQSESQARILALSDDGSLLLLEVEEASLTSIGLWTVTAEFDASATQGVVSGEIELTPFAINGSSSSSSSESKENQGSSSSSRPTTSLSRDGLVASHGDFFTIMGLDGAARLFDAEAAVGLGETAGVILRAREPYGINRRHELLRKNTDDAHHPHHHKHSMTELSSTSDAISHRKMNSYQEEQMEILQEQQKQQVKQEKQRIKAQKSLAKKQRADKKAAKELRRQQLLKESFLHQQGQAGEFKQSEEVVEEEEEDEEEEEEEEEDDEEDDDDDDDDDEGAVVMAATAGTLPPQKYEFGLNEFGVNGPSLYQEAIGESKEWEKERMHRESMEEKHAAAERRRAARRARIAAAEAEGISARAQAMFELSALSPRERDLNHRRLRAFLDAQGEFPSRYRTLIWRFLLQLPENSDAQAFLASKGIHNSFANLATTYPLKSEELLVRLQSVCSQLAHWAPVLGEAPYMPQLCFPFVVLFGSDELAMLECAVTIMMWWGHSWNSNFPDKPAHITEALDNLLYKHDFRLSHHLKNLGVSAGEVCWRMISNLFTELLNRADWLRLMDFLLVNFNKPGLLLLAPIAFLRAVKTSLLSAETRKHAMSFCQEQQGFDIKEITQDIKDMFSNTPHTLLTALVTPPRATPVVAFEQHHDVDEQDDALTIEEEGSRPPPPLSFNHGKGGAIFPLPKAEKYPTYDSYPVHVLEWQIKDKDRSDALRKELARKHALRNQLSRRVMELEADHAEWMQKRLTSADTETKRRLEVMEKEKVHMKELQKLEEEITKQRVDALALLEKAATAEMDAMDRASAEAQQFIRASEAHLSEKMALAVTMQKHRELAEAAEAATEERLRKLHMRRSREEWVKGLAGTLKGKEEELEARDTLLAEEWRRQDEDMARRRTERIERSKSLAEEESLSRLQEELSFRMQRLVLSREAKVMELERTRAIRLAKEQTDEAIESAERSQLLLQKQELAAATEKAAQLAQHGHKEIHGKLLESVDKIREESARLMEAERIHVLRQNKARQAARDANLRREWAEKQGSILKGVVATEAELQEQMLRLSRAAMANELEEASIVGASLKEPLSGAVQAMHEAQRDVELLSERVLKQQRERFQEARQAMSSHSQASSSASSSAPATAKSYSSTRDVKDLSLAQAAHKASKALASRVGELDVSEDEEEEDAAKTGDPALWAFR